MPGQAMVGASSRRASRPSWVCTSNSEAPSAGTKQSLIRNLLLLMSYNHQFWKEWLKEQSRALLPVIYRSWHPSTKTCLEWGEAGGDQTQRSLLRHTAPGVASSPRRNSTSLLCCGHTPAIGNSVSGAKPPCTSYHALRGVFFQHEGWKTDFQFNERKEETNNSAQIRSSPTILKAQKVEQKHWFWL